MNPIEEINTILILVAIAKLYPSPNLIKGQIPQKRHCEVKENPQPKKKILPFSVFQIILQIINAIIHSSKEPPIAPKACADLLGY